MSLDEDSAIQGDANRRLAIVTKRGKLKKVESLLEAEADVNFLDEEGCAPLHLAARRSHLQIVKVLIDYGANVNLEDKLGFTPLHWAAVRGHLAVAGELIESSARVEKVDVNGATPLHWAARNGHLALVELLILKAGVKLDLKDKSGMTAHDWAIKKGREDVARFIGDLQDSSTSAVSKKKTRNGKLKLEASPPLAVVVVFPGSGNKQTDLEKFFAGLKIRHIELSVKRTVAFVEFQNSDDYFEALTMNDLKWNEKYNLVIHPAKRMRVNQRPFFSKSQAQTDPRVSKHINASKNERCIAFFHSCVEQGQEVQLRDFDGATPLHWASHRNNLKLVQLLIDNGAKINAMTNNRSTPLHFASTSDSPQVIEYLAQKKANLEEKDCRGETPLHRASRLNLIGNVKVLLQNGANVEATNYRKQTPVQLAARNSHVNVVKLLLESNAKVPPQDMSEFNAKCRLVDTLHDETEVQLLADFLVKKYLHLKSLAEGQKQTFFGVGKGKLSGSRAWEMEEVIWRKLDLRESKKTRMYEVVKRKAN